jgi:hypothetical protein
MGIALEKDCTGFHGERDCGASATWLAQRARLEGKPWRRSLAVLAGGCIRGNAEIMCSHSIRACSAPEQRAVS